MYVHVLLCISHKQMIIYIDNEINGHILYVCVLRWGIHDTQKAGEDKEKEAKRGQVRSTRSVSLRTWKSTLGKVIRAADQSI